MPTSEDTGGFERRQGTATKNSQFITNAILGILSIVLTVTGVLAWDIKTSQEEQMRQLDSKVDTLTGLFGSYQIRQENRMTTLENKVQRLEKDCAKLDCR